MNRRQFLHHLGVTGGGAVAYQALAVLGLVQPTSRAHRYFNLAHTGDAKGRRVVVLGAGVAGLCAAYELRKLGYGCRVLEARARPGGRCVTIRDGSEEVETDGTRQVARFDEGLYFNPGPTRVPQDHVTLDYCRELGVAVEPFVNVNDAAYQCRGGARVRMRDAQQRGAAHAADVAELLAKVTDQRRLDQPLTRDEREAIVQLLRSRATGFGPGGDPRAQQLVMFQPVGGVDRFAQALADRVAQDVEYGARVTAIRQPENGARGVTIRYADRAGAARDVSGDYCVCTIPPPVLKSIDADFADDMKRAIAHVEFTSAAKIGLQFRTRFWETEDRIFGGISQTDQCITQIIYPSYGWLGSKGVVVGCYNYGDDARAIGALPPEGRIERALAEGERVHPQYRREFDGRGFSVCWDRIPFTLGGWAVEGRAGKRLAEPDGRVYLAGEHMTMMGGWMAGALESARTVVEAIHARVQAEG
jgi:monoamine oxidase